jgi:hypothetical protein
MSCSEQHESKCLGYYATPLSSLSAVQHHTLLLDLDELLAVSSLMEEHDPVILPICQPTLYSISSDVHALLYTEQKTGVILNDNYADLYNPSFELVTTVQESQGLGVQSGRKVTCQTATR